MGYEVTCQGTLGKQTAEGQAQLETDFIQFKSNEFRFKVALMDLTEVKATGGFLNLKWASESARLQLGEKPAANWAGKILNPPTRLDKLGIKPGATAYLEGEFEAAFGLEVSGHLVALSKSDLDFLAASEQSALLKAATVATRMRKDAALWIVYPKGRTEIREMDVLTAGRAAGLKDVKVVRFSDSHTALKFVVPLQDR